MGLTCTLTGTIYRDDGAVATGAVVTFTLCAPRNTHWTSNNRVVLRAPLTATTDGSGNFSQVVARNDELTPAGTYWKMECADAALLKHIAANEDTLDVIDAPDLDTSAQVFSGLDDPDADWVAHGHAQTLAAAEKLQAATNLGLNLSASQLLGQASSGGTGLPVAVALGTGLAMSGATLNVTLSTSLTVGTTAIASGTTGRILYDNAGVLGELPVGTGVATALAINVGSAGAFLTSAVTSITGTANEITVTGTTTPTLSLPSALTFTGKTVTGGTFNSGAFNGTVGATTPATVAGTTITGTSSLTLGTTGGTGGSIVLNGSTSGSSALSVSATGVLALPSFTVGSITVGSDVVSAGRITAQNPSTASAGIDINAYNTGTQVTSGHPWMRLGGGSSDYLMINAGLTGGYVDICTDLGSGLRVWDGTGGHVTYLTTPATGTLRLTTNGSTLGTLDVGTITASSTTSLLLGTAGSAVGNIGFRNATSGTTTLAPATGALGTGTVTLPLSGTLATLEGANTFTGANVNSTAGAASLPAMKFSGVPFAGTGTTSFPLVYINDANATASTTLNTAGTYLGINIDGTQDGINVLKDGVSKFKVDSAGKITSTSDRILLGNGGFIYWDGTNWGVYTQTVSNAPFTCGTLALNGHTTVGVNNVYDLGTASLGFRDLWAARNGTIGGTLAVTGASTFTGDIIAGSATMALLNTTATTVNFAGAATAINIGAATATLKLGTATSTSTATPAIFDCGGTYADTVTSAKAKWKLYSDGTAINTYGIGISLSKFNFFTASSAAYSFLFADVEKANLSNAGLLTLQGGLIATTGAFSSTLAVTGATTLTGNLTSNGALISTPQALSGAGAVNVTTLTTAFTSTGAAQALSLADGTSGQLKTISHVVDGGSGVLTPTTKSGYTTITFTNVGDSVTLQYHTTAGWCIVGVFGAVPA